MGRRYPWASALVTGASSGIGRSMVVLLASAGVPTTVVARRADRLEELAAEHDGIEVLAADLTSAPGVSAVVGRLSDPDRPVELLVNNAGFGTAGAFVEAEPERLDDEVRLNVAALTRLTHAALVPMVAAGRGWVLNVSSVASFQPGPGLAVYSATKAYVTSLSETLHVELAGTGVRMTALCPGLTRTEFQSVAGTGTRAERFALAWLDADDVAARGLADCARGRALSVPGLAYKTLAALSSIAPRWVARNVAAFAAAAGGRR